jgi:hypothetical protein
MNLANILLATALQSQPVSGSEIGNFVVNWSYADRTDTVFETYDQAWLPETDSYGSERRLRNLARPKRRPPAAALARSSCRSGWK